MHKLKLETDYLTWSQFFLENRETEDSLPFSDTNKLTEEERALITPSIQQFELGENSEGNTFLNAGKRYAYDNHDYDYVSALTLFIAEENRHSSYLRRFMQKQDIPIVRKHWVDSSFRKIRKLQGLETCVAVLVTAEIIAKSYYRALRDCTDSPLLKAICSQILRDEVKHIWFQASILRKLRSKQSSLRIRFTEALQHILMLGTCFLVWRQFETVFRKGGISFSSLFKRSFAELRALNNLARVPLSDKSSEELTTNFNRAPSHQEVSV